MVTAGFRPTLHSLAVFLGLPLCTVGLYLAAWSVAPADDQFMISYFPAVVVLAGFGLANRWFDWAPVAPATRALVVGRGRFTAPAHLVRRAVAGGFVVSFVACFAAQPLLRGRGFTEMALYAPPVVAALIVAWVPRPRVELSPAGVRSRREVGSVLVPWDRITLIGYGPAEPDVVVHAVGLPPFELGARRLATHAAFLADTLWYYRNHPDQRPAIGTVAGHDRLLLELAGLSDDPPVTLPSAQVRWN